MERYGTETVQFGPVAGQIVLGVLLDVADSASVECGAGSDVGRGQ